VADIHFSLPKYARLVTELQRRIRDGEYAPGQMLPSEAQLVREFGVGRTTVVRGLQLLQQEGWITREQGVGSFVKGQPVAVGSPRPGRMLLDRPETDKAVSVVVAGSRPVPRVIADALGSKDGSAVLRRLVVTYDGEPSELVSCWVPAELAYGTDLDKPEALPGGIRQHLASVRHVRVDHITERLTARLPTTEEARLLGIKKGAPVLGVLAIVADAADAPILVADVVLVGGLHELEDVYSVES
jgi:DNA-binding GntR family transcriptional regulator